MCCECGYVCMKSCFNLKPVSVGMCAVSVGMSVDM